jgi:hypothetical protein
MLLDDITKCFWRIFTIMYFVRNLLFQKESNVSESGSVSVRRRWNIGEMPIKFRSPERSIFLFLDLPWWLMHELERCGRKWSWIDERHEKRYLWFPFSKRYTYIETRKKLRGVSSQKTTINSVHLEELKNFVKPVYSLGFLGLAFSA